MLLFYLCVMPPEDDLQQRWLKLETKLKERSGKQPDFEDVLLFIGVHESGRPPKNFTEKEIQDLKQLALCSILAPEKYFELMWVDDTGWPHFRNLERVPVMIPAERESFLKPHILKYAEKNKLI